MFATELLRFSSASHLLGLFPEELRAVHQVREPAAGDRPAPERKATTTIGRARQHLVQRPEAPKKQVGLWDGWEDADEDAPTQNDSGDQSELDLDALGL